MRVPDDKTKVAQKLMSPEFLFETSEQNLVQLQIRRNIAKDQSVDIMPILKNIYFSIQNGDQIQASKQVADLTGLLVAADLGIAKDYLIELEVQRVMPKVVRQLNKELKLAANNIDGSSKSILKKTKGKKFTKTNSDGDQK